MNIGTTRHSKYICDKCKSEIRYSYRKGFIGLYTYAKREKNSIFKKEFDLCSNCEKKLKEWLNTIEITTTKEIINQFPRYIK